MDRLLGWALLAATLSLIDCEPGPPPGAFSEMRPPLEQGELELVTVGIHRVAPEGGDGSSLFEIGWRDVSGEVRPLPFYEPVTSAASWAGGVVVVDDARSMWQVLDDGRIRALARDVVGRPALSEDGALLAYSEARGSSTQVWVRDRETLRPRLVASGLQSAGAFRFAPEGDHLLFVGARRGGVAGLFVAELRYDGHVRCLTNCDLLAGRPWGDAFVPSPLGTESLDFRGPDVSWEAGDVSGSGQRVTRRYRYEEER